MFIINSESNSKLAKVIAVVSVIAVVFGLFMQVIGLLSFTNTWIGKRIRRVILKGSCNYMGDAIDITQTHMPEWEEKLG